MWYGRYTGKSKWNYNHYKESETKQSWVGWYIVIHRQHTCHYFIEPLMHVSNLSITQGVFPHELKVAKVIPLFKSNDPMVFSNNRPGARLTKAYDVTIPRYRNSHEKKGNSKMHILCEISKVPFEISHKILNSYTAKYAFYEVLKNWRLTIS